MKINRVMLADSYKYSHPNQYPDGTTYMFDFIEARSNKVYDKVVFFGLQYILENYLKEPIKQWEVDEAYEFAMKHGIPFPKEGWDYIVNELKGKLPIEIRAVEEGSLIPTGNVLVTVESTDPKVFWIVGFIETLLLKIWYPVTVATKSFYVRKMILEHLEKSGDPSEIDFKFHNFGDRGSSSVETAAIGGIAHLTSFKGTDNFHALMYAKEFYNSEIAGFSIPASEHSTVTSWGKENRFKMYESYIEKFKNYPIIACVMDSYDIYKDVDFITSGTMKDKIESDDYPVFVIRPDSGEPVGVLDRLLDIMEQNNVQYYINNKGYKVFKKYRFIWGDGINPETIDKILTFFEESGYSADNIAFGSGGDLMQNINRDTLGFAMKCSAIKVGDKIIDVFKEPITDKNKKSKKGILDLIVDENGNYKTVQRGEGNSVLKTVYKNGEIINRTNMDKIYTLLRKNETF